MAVSSAGMMVLMIALMSGGGNHLLDYASTEAYWQSKQVNVSLESLVREVADVKAADVSAFIQDLAAPAPDVRQQAAVKIAQAGRGALPQLREAAQSPNPEVAASAKRLLAELAATSKAAEVRRLMAIRTLGEMKKPEALPALRPLLESKDMFVAEYARRAIASIEDRPYDAPKLSPEQRMSDVWLLPAGCRAVMQQSRLDAPFTSLDAILKTAVDAPGVNLTPQQLAQQVTGLVLMAAEQVGDVRIDGFTVGLSGEIGNDRGFVVLVVRGQYDHQAAQAVLRKQQIASRQSNGFELFTPNENSVLMPLSPDRFVVLAGPVAQQLPIEEVSSALIQGKGGLQASPEMTKLIKSVDTAQPLWGVVSMTDSYREAPVLSAFSVVRMIGSLEGQSMHVKLNAEGDNAEQVAAAVRQLNAGVEQALASVKEASQQMKFLTPIVDALASIRCTAEGAKAELTGTMPADSRMLILFPAMIGIRTGGPQPPPEVQAEPVLR